MEDADYVEAEQDIRLAVESYKEFCDINQLDFEDRMADVVYEAEQG